MTTYELAIAPNYVESWGEQEAVRELIQNALDHGDWSFKISGDNLHICSRGAVLSKSSLLLGYSDKKEGSIGKFGEGYKLALLVLTRLGYKVKINNYALKEEWVPRLKQSRKFESKILAIDVSKKYFSKVEHSLEIVTEDIVPKLDFTKILWMYDNLCAVKALAITTEYGEVLTLPEFKGRIYVKGLWVCDIKDLQYGYSFNPEYISLDRDRRVLDTFGLLWLTSKIWANLPEHYKEIKEMVKSNAKDIKYLASFSDTYSDIKSKVIDKLMVDFHREHGYNAVPVATQNEVELVKSTTIDDIAFRPVVVSEVEKAVLAQSTGYMIQAAKLAKSTKCTPAEQLQQFREKHSYLFTSSEVSNDFNNLIAAAERWTSF